MLHYLTRKLRYAAVVPAVLSGPCAAFAAEVELVSGRSPAEFVRVLSEFGHKAGPIEGTAGNPATDTDVGPVGTRFIFGGCTDGHDCAYVALVAKFSDVRNPPAAWVSKTNEFFDLAKVFVGSDNMTVVSTAIPLAGDGISRTNLRAALDFWNTSVTGIAQSAIEAKLISQ